MAEQNATDDELTVADLEVGDEIRWQDDIGFVTKERTGTVVNTREVKETDLTSSEPGTPIAEVDFGLDVKEIADAVVSDLECIEEGDE
jgi:hypothetical protein